MKKIILLLVIVLGFNFFSTALVLIKPKDAGPITQVNPSFMEVYGEALRLNESRFKDLNKIQVGDTVLFPSQYSEFNEYWIADAPYNGVHDCIWRLTKRYMEGQLITWVIQKDDVPKTKPEPITVVKSSMFSLGNIFLYLIGLIVAVFIIWMLTRIFLKPLAKKREIVNPDENPVIPGGLSDNPAAALEQINAAYPNRPRALRVQRIILVGPEGVSSVDVMMTFSDGVKRSTLRAGENATRIEREGNVVDYYRQHCGNLFGEIYQGGYNLPLGWTWRLATPESEVIIPEIPETPSNSSADSQPVGIPVTRLDADGIQKILDSMEKNNVKSLIYEGLEVSRSSKQKEKKD